MNASAMLAFGGAARAAARRDGEAATLAAAVESDEAHAVLASEVMARRAAVPALRPALEAIDATAAGWPRVAQVASAVRAAVVVVATRSARMGRPTSSSGAHAPAVTGHTSARSLTPSSSVSRSSGGAAVRSMRNGPKGPLEPQLPTWSQTVRAVVKAAPLLAPPVTVVPRTNAPSAPSTSPAPAPADGPRAPVRSAPPHGAVLGPFDARLRSRLARDGRRAAVYADRADRACRGAVASHVAHDASNRRRRPVLGPRGG